MVSVIRVSRATAVPRPIAANYSLFWASLQLVMELVRTGDRTCPEENSERRLSGANTATNPQSPLRSRGRDRAMRGYETASSPYIALSLAKSVPVALLVTLLHLLVSQRHHRIHLSRAPHGDVHRRQRDHSQQHYCHTVGAKIKRARLKGRSR